MASCAGVLRSLLFLIVLVFVLQYYVEFCFPFAGWFTVTPSEPPATLSWTKTGEALPGGRGRLESHAQEDGAPPHHRRP